MSPTSEAELIARARALGGARIGELARTFAVAVPADGRRAKGFVGSLIERALGGANASRPGPDFEVLGVELKTLPVDRDGRIRESTFVCSAACARGLEWPESPVRRKLARVLWVTVEADPSIPLAARRVGAAFTWSPDETQEDLLRSDFELLTDALTLGLEVDARRGQVLQLRPKAANGAVRARGPDRDGAPCWTAPRAFYLRRSFTSAVLAARGLIARKCS